MDEIYQKRFFFLRYIFPPVFSNFMVYDFLRHRNLRSSQQNSSPANAASQKENRHRTKILIYTKSTTITSGLSAGKYGGREVSKNIRILRKNVEILRENL